MTPGDNTTSAPGGDRGAKGSMPNPGVEGEAGAGTIPQRDRPVPAPQPDGSAGAPEGDPLAGPPPVGSDRVNAVTGRPGRG